MDSTPSVQLLDVEQAALLLGTKERFVRRLVAERRIAFHKIGKFVRFTKADLDDYITRSRVEPVQPVLTYEKGEPTYA